MTVRRIMGIETEYGVHQQGNPRANPMLMSSQVVLGYVSLLEEEGARARWDYRAEDPLMDARGFHLQRASAHPSLLTDDPSAPAPGGPVAGADALGAEGSEAAGSDTTSCTEADPHGNGAERDRGHRRSRLAWTEQARPTTESYDDPGAANAILTNGARLYVDHAHPEYSSPEVTNPHDAVVWDVAGEHVMRAAGQAASRLSGGEISLYKNNVDGKGASYGTHENYLVERRVPFALLVGLLTPFFVTRQIFTGSGRVGLGQHGERSGFQLSQRADYLEAEVGLETTLRRPIVNTRDEPHANRERWRRLHVIVGDANLFEAATLLKLGTTSLVLWLAENIERVPGGQALLDRVTLADPVGAVSAVSHDLSLRQQLPTRSGERLTALEIQRVYLDTLRTALEQGAPGPIDASTADILTRWQSVLDGLATDPARVAHQVEWVAKHRLLDRMRVRDGGSWSAPRLAALDVQWTDVRPGRSVYQTLVRAGAVERVTTEAEVTQAVSSPPRDTRAFLRGEAVARYPQQVAAASWDAIVFDVPEATRLRRIAMSDPWQGSAEHLGALLEASPDAVTFLDQLSEQRARED